MFIKERKALQKTATQECNGHGNNNAYFSWIYDTDTGPKFGTPRWGYCHGDLMSDRGYVPKNTTHLCVGITPLKVDETEALRYYDWLLNRSPFADIFLEKDVSNILEVGLLLSTDHPNNLVLLALIASRWATEIHSKEITARWPTYQKLLKAGATENEAFIFAHLFNGKDGGTVLQRLHNGHSVFDLQDANEKVYRNFLENTPEKRLQTFKERCGYASSGNVGANTWGERRSDAFFSWMKTLKPRRLVVQCDHNIFRKKSQEGFIIADVPDLSDIIKQIKERIYA